MNNLQELLKDLRDIHEPAAISYWPPAIGWWLLPVIIICLVLAFYWWWKRKKTPDYKKIALLELKNIITDFKIQNNKRKTSGEIALLIRQAIVAKYGNHKVAGMIGEEWLAYLDDISKTDSFSSGAGKIIISVPYAKQVDSDLDVEELIAATRKLLGRL